MQVLLFTPADNSQFFHIPARRLPTPMGIIEKSRMPFKEFTVKLQLEVRAVDETTVLFCKGRFTYRDEAVAFSQMVGPLLTENRALVVEMSELEIIDSAGLGELVVVHMWANASACALKIAGANPRILQLFELTNLLSVFDVYRTLDEALLSVRAAASSNSASTAA